MLEHIERSSFSRLGDPGSSHPRRPGIWRMRVLAQKMATDNNSAKGITYHGKRLERQWKENTVKIGEDLNWFNSVCVEIPGLAGCIRENED